MRVLHSSLVVTLLLLQPVLAADLDRIERTIAKEPHYESKQPGYVLLAFGPDAQSLVWLVVDDECVYIDRNGNRDLTDPDERLRAAEVRQLKNPDAEFEEYRIYRLGDIAASSATRRYQQLTFRQFRRPTEKFVANTPEDRQEKATLTAYPNLAGNIAVQVNDYRQNAGPPFGRKASEAPIIHFDGPLTIHVDVDDAFVSNPILLRDGQESELSFEISIGTPGLGTHAFAYCDYNIVPVDVHPVVKAEFVNMDRENLPIVKTFVLTERC